MTVTYSSWNRAPLRKGRIAEIVIGTIGSTLVTIAAAQPPLSNLGQPASSLHCSDHQAYPLPEQPCSPPVSKRITPACQYFQGLKVAIEDQATYLVPEYAAQVADASQAPVEVQGSGCQRILERLYDRLVGYICPERTRESQQEFVQALQREGCFGIAAEDKRTYTVKYLPGQGLVAELVDPRTEMGAQDSTAGIDQAKLEVADYRKQLVGLIAPELARNKPTASTDKAGAVVKADEELSYQLPMTKRGLP